MNTISQRISSFSGKHILVLGDVMLDKYIFAEVNRISPEAPVPVARVKKEQYYIGGAANVAANVISLGGECSIIGLIGEDEVGKQFLRICTGLGINTDGIFYHDKPTTQKVRVIGANQQLLRIDYEELSSNPKEPQILSYLDRIIDEIDIIIVSDYNKGFITPQIITELKKSNKKILVDPKPEHIDYYTGVHLIKLNKTEAESVTHIKEHNETDIITIGEAITKRVQAHVLYTRGKEGMSLFEHSGNITHIPSQAKEVYDVSGAGDTSMAALALSIASGADLHEATIIANQAAGIKVGKMGTQPVNNKELLTFFEQEDSKIKTWEELRHCLDHDKQHNRKIVFTNGCFDILHIGHTTLLKQAKALGNILVLGLNTDASVKRLKGPTRPIINEHERAEVLAALESVDYIVFFEQDTPQEIIELVKPDILVKGGDYKIIKDIVGYDYVISHGGKVVTINLVEGKSTTNILQKMNKEIA